MFFSCQMDRNYASTDADALTVLIYTDTVASVHICTPMARLMRVNFKGYYVNFASFSIMHPLMWVLLNWLD